MASLSCALCGEDAQLMCSGSRKVAYCQRGCQKAHWPSHKAGCLVAQHQIVMEAAAASPFAQLFKDAQERPPCAHCKRPTPAARVVKCDFCSIEIYCSTACRKERAIEHNEMCREWTFIFVMQPDLGARLNLCTRMLSRLGLQSHERGSGWAAISRLGDVTVASIHMERRAAFIEVLTLDGVTLAVAVPRTMLPHVRVGDRWTANHLFALSLPAGEKRWVVANELVLVRPAVGVVPDTMAFLPGQLHPAHPGGIL